MLRLQRDHLETLLAAVDHGTLDAAARALAITPSAVSQRIKAMEQQLGPDWKSKVYEKGAEAFTIKNRFVAAPFAKVGAPTPAPTPKLTVPSRTPASAPRPRGPA